MDPDRIRKRPPLTAEQRETFLDLIANGKTRQEAAETIGSTGTRIRGLIFRDNDFAEQYAEALDEAGNPENPLGKKIADLEKLRLLERLLDEYILRALDSDRGKQGSSNRALQNLLTLLHDTFKPFLEARTRHIHEGSVGVYALPQIDTDKWTIAQHEEFVHLRRRMNELLVIAAPDHAPSLTPTPLELPSSNGEVIEGEYAEVS